MSIFGKKLGLSLAGMNIQSRLVAPINVCVLESLNLDAVAKYSDLKSV